MNRIRIVSARRAAPPKGGTQTLASATALCSVPVVGYRPERIARRIAGGDFKYAVIDLSESLTIVQQSCREKRSISVAVPRNAVDSYINGTNGVSLHHRRGAGIGRSQHAGLTTVCDGIDTAGRRLTRVLRDESVLAVVPRADTEYHGAIDTVQNHGLQASSKRKQVSLR